MSNKISSRRFFLTQVFPFCGLLAGAGAWSYTSQKANDDIDFSSTHMRVARLLNIIGLVGAVECVFSDALGYGSEQSRNRRELISFGALALGNVINLSSVYKSHSTKEQR
jgi:hypothetical protein